MKLIEIGKGILAVTISVLVFHSIGLLPNRFWNILATLGVMVIYVKNNNDVEGFLIYSFFFLSIFLIIRFLSILLISDILMLRILFYCIAYQFRQIMYFDLL